MSFYVKLYILSAVFGFEFSAISIIHIYLHFVNTFFLYFGNFLFTFFCIMKSQWALLHILSLSFIVRMGSFLFWVKNSIIFSTYSIVHTILTSGSTIIHMQWTQFYKPNMYFKTTFSISIKNNLLKFFYDISLIKFFKIYFAGVCIKHFKFMYPTIFYKQNHNGRCSIIMDNLYSWIKFII